ncbi:MAG: hypothetical protein Q8S00_22735 [Deltaproteobacteria bacterium]|nr:hypothetical protein [Deltaproteobacteria bacterium]
MYEMKHQCRSDGHGSRAPRDEVPVYLEGGLSGLARELRDITGQSSENIGSHCRLEGSELAFGWKHMEKLKNHDSLQAFAEIERLTSKVYFRFSHLFLNHPSLRDFWWEMGMVKERQAAILMAIKVACQNCAGKSETGTGREGATCLKGQLTAYLSKGTPAITVEEAFRKALEIESFEINVILKLVDSETGDLPKPGVRTGDPDRTV